MSATLPDSGEPIAASLIWVKNRKSDSVQLDDMVIFSASIMHSVDGPWIGLEFKRSSTASKHFRVSQLGKKFCSCLDRNFLYLLFLVIFYQREMDLLMY